MTQRLLIERARRFPARAAPVAGHRRLRLAILYCVLPALTASTVAASISSPRGTNAL